MAEQVHTIRSTEQRFRPVTLGCVASAIIADAILVTLGWPLSPLRWAAAFAAAALLGMCLLRSLRSHVSVGMIPVALFSIGFAGLAGSNAVVATIGLAILAFFLIWFIVLWRAYAGAAPVAADAALVVLGCEVRGGRPSGTLERRLQVAKALLDEAPERICVVTGGFIPAEGMTEAEAMAPWLERHGIEAARIIPEPRALNTEENLAFSWELLDARGHAAQRCVISSDFHLWRVRDIARRACISPMPSLVPAKTPAQGWLVQWCREVLVNLDWLRKCARQSSDGASRQ